ncbi:MAG: FAD:protein FMN transferase [Muribaculaceae bacterium]|nr:FAD:protein FMN transferase [Muribaculaceae bacterium]
MKRTFCLVSLISALFFINTSCSHNFFKENGETWGTSYHIVYDSPVPLGDSIRQQLLFIDNELSMFNPSSTISRINRNEISTTSNTIDKILALAKDVSHISGGAYDVTVAPLVNIWGFGNTADLIAPDDEKIAATLEYVGINKCHIDPSGKIVKPEKMCFDFSSIAKGYGIDCIGDMFDRNNVNNYMIEIGGEVLVKGLNAKGKPWRIQIDSPAGGMSHIALDIVEMGPERTAVASSGNYRNFRRDSTGTIMGHIISPLTGKPASGSIAASTVIAPSCAFADALATALMAVENPDSASHIAEKHCNGAIIVDYDGGIKKIGCLTTPEDL